MTIAKKLTLKEGKTLGLLNLKEEADFLDLERDLDLPTPIDKPLEAQVLLILVSTQAEVNQVFSNYADQLRTTTIWLCYKKGNVVEVNREKIWATALTYQWRAVSQIALDSVWSALRIRPMTAKELAEMI